MGIREIVLASMLAVGCGNQVQDTGKKTDPNKDKDNKDSKKNEAVINKNENENPLKKQIDAARNEIKVKETKKANKQEKAKIKKDISLSPRQLAEQAMNKLDKSLEEVQKLAINNPKEFDKKLNELRNKVTKKWEAQIPELNLPAFNIKENKVQFIKAIKDGLAKADGRMWLHYPDEKNLEEFLDEHDKIIILVPHQHQQGIQGKKTIQNIQEQDLDIANFLNYLQDNCPTNALHREGNSSLDPKKLTKNSKSLDQLTKEFHPTSAVQQHQKNKDINLPTLALDNPADMIKQLSGFIFFYASKDRNYVSNMTEAVFSHTFNQETKQIDNDKQNLLLYEYINMFKTTGLLAYYDNVANPGANFYGEAVVPLPLIRQINLGQFSNKIMQEVNNQFLERDKNWFQKVGQMIQSKSYHAGFRGGLHLQQYSPKNTHEFAQKLQKYAQENNIGVLIPMTKNAARRFNFK